MGDISKYAALVALVVSLAALGAPMRAQCASPYTVLHSFCQEDAPCASGSGPSGRLVQSGPDFFGLTSFTDGFGRVYKFAPATGVLTTLHTFTGRADGGYPAFLTLGPGRTLYGITSYGGTYGGGTLFELTTDGHLNTVHAFCSPGGPSCTAGPGSFTFDAKGNLYGLTGGGGANGYGEVYEISAAGQFSVLYSFCPHGDCRVGGDVPVGIVVGKDGDLYVTTSFGSGGGGGGLGGSILKLTKGGTPTVLHNFCQQLHCIDGDQPLGPLVQAANLDFYGVTIGGGATHGGTIQGGTVFQISPTGSFKTIHSFCGEKYCADGIAPRDGLVLAKDGVSLYGVAGYGPPRFASSSVRLVARTPNAGGSYDHGVIFKITTGGGYSVVYDFCSQPGCFDGDNVGGDPIFAGDGNLYGVTTSGGPYQQAGVIYQYKLVP